LIDSILQAEPRALWHQYAPVNRDSEMAGIETAFGQRLSPVYDFTQADVIVSLDSDFLTEGPGSVRYSKDFASRRRVFEGGRSITRFYSAESYPTSSGTLADHRLPVRASEFEALVAALADELGLPGSGSRPVHLNASTVAWLEAAAVDLESNRGRSVVIAGESASPECQAVVHAINDWLGNSGNTVNYCDSIEARPVDCGDSLRRLVSDMSAGEVDILLILGSNPIYETPADLGFQEAFLNVERRIHVGLYEDETAELSHWHLPEAHYLESWGDARAFDGRVCFTQPLIEPLYQGKTHAEVLSLFAGNPTGSLELLKSHWSATAGADGFNARWRKWLHDGFSTEFDSPIVRPTLQVEQLAIASRSLENRESDSPGLELIFRPDPTVYDGSFSNNGWLQECPKPLTKLTWDNAAIISPALAQREGLETTQVVEVNVGDRSLEIPVWVLPGHPDRSVTIHLGYGRRTTGRIGTGTGFDAYQLRSVSSPWLRTGAAIRRTEGKHALASTQMHSNIELEGPEAEKRHLVRVGTLDDFEHDPEFVHHVGHDIPSDLSIFPDWEYEGYAWGLSVDLSACTGCNACVVACQAENNIPIVGKEMVAKGREMQWIRIDRYFQGDLDQPQVHNQPVMCMHCEQAPCEPVCPVGATVHSDEGLNDMVYNRCVGTRYCSNNCPYKVRRFNFLKYNDTETSVVKMMRNPDVTVRVRGVMEKCTYCVQRINQARITARTEDRDIRDGEIKTACQQVCPSEAILFGDINDADSEVSRSKANPLNYGILEELGNRPRTSYLAKMRNPNNKLETG
jgi:molybdopterin-containing oxidoreductase family iron-sulfur binding subunit